MLEQVHEENTVAFRPTTKISMVWEAHTYSTQPHTQRKYRHFDTDTTPHLSRDQSGLIMTRQTGVHTTNRILPPTDQRAVTS
jgi:hypothetical protein